MTGETTYYRFQRALEAIADGCESPIEVATEALRSRASRPNVERRAEAAARKRAFTRRRLDALNGALVLYFGWLREGRPPIARYARGHGVHRSRMRRLLEKADRTFPYEERRLSLRRSRDFKTNAEIEGLDEG